jgi:hypothetical protein
MKKKILCGSFGRFFLTLFCTKHLQQISDYFVFKEDDALCLEVGRRRFHVLIWKIFHDYLHKTLASKHQVSFLFKRR